jgi:glycosyltransferase involved in cell wall biosynthesis
MKIVYIVPGTGGTFYCQNCMRDCELVKTLREQGHDVFMIPVYLPILIDADGLSRDIPVFFGGVNVYLQQKFKLFRNTPRWLDKLFDASWILRKAASREGTTESAGLGPLTLSMLQGGDGNQKKELERLIAWLVEHEKPELIHLSNSLLIGMAKELKTALNIPILCTLQDEEAWLDGINPPYSDQCWEAMSKESEHVDAFIGVSKWYGDEMRRRMHLSEEKMRVVPLGIDLKDRVQSDLSSNPPVLGYLSKMCESLGLGLLTDAFIELKKNPKLKDLKLRATGGQLGDDRGYVEKLKKKLAKHGFENDAEFLDGFDGEQRREFIQTLTVLSVPAIGGEAFGMFITEALAAGVPVVQPDAGGFPEVVHATGGGIIYDPEDPNGLVEALETMLLNPEQLKAYSEQGKKVVFEQFGIDRMAEQFSDIYESLVT